MIIQEIESLIQEISPTSMMTAAAEEWHQKFAETTKAITSIVNSTLDKIGSKNTIADDAATSLHSLDKMNSKFANGFDSKSNLDDIPDGVDPLNFATRSRMNYAEMFKDIKSEFEFTGNFLDRLAKKSENIADIVGDYFVKYQSNPLIRDLVVLSRDNPHIFNAMVVAVPAILIGAVGGSYAYIKKLKTANAVKAELDKATTELENAETDSEKNEASKKVALLGAKAIVLTKASK